MLEVDYLCEVYRAGTVKFSSDAVQYAVHTCISTLKVHA